MAHYEPQHRPGEYGILALDACDPESRKRVVGILRPDDCGDEVQLDGAAREDLRRYIQQLEDALLRHHWGGLPDGHIAELLKCATGLDIAGRSRELLAMTAIDA